MLAMRDARAFTGRELIIRFAGHFHGWHDYAMAGYQPPFDTSTSTGVPKAVTETMLVAYPNNIESVRQLLDTHPDQVAAVILEPGGGSRELFHLGIGRRHAEKDRGPRLAQVRVGVGQVDPLGAGHGHERKARFLGQMSVRVGRP